MRSILLILAAALGLAGPAGAEEPIRAAQVVFRGARSLEHLLRLTTQSAWRDAATPRPVAIVIDVNPFTRFAEPELARALRALDGPAGEHRNGWRVGRLGARLGRAVPSPGRLAAKLPAVFAEDSEGGATIAALRKSLQGFTADGGVIVYVAASRFEDDEGLEILLAALRTRRQEFNVIGPEGGLLHPHLRDAGGSGDTAWPHVFDRVTTNTWYFRRALSARTDLAAKLDAYSEARRRGIAPPRHAFLDALCRHRGESLASYPAPPSSFGPYGLMRLSGATGGHYGLWSWNPVPNYAAPVFDYGRCNHFAPDLRSRDAIFADLPRRRLAVALLDAWRLVSSGACQLALHTPPIDPDRLVPVLSRRVQGGGLGLPHRGRRTAFLRDMEARLQRLDRAIGVLDVALAAPAEDDGVDARFRADADLMRHILRLYRFASVEKREAVLAWERTSPSRAVNSRRAWTLQPHRWVSGGPDPSRLKLSDDRPYDVRGALRLLRQHRTYLERYRGTPYASVVARNDIDTYRVVKRRPRRSRGKTGPHTDASSRGRTPVTPGPGGSQGGGPTTGG